MKLAKSLLIVSIIFFSILISCTTSSEPDKKYPEPDKLDIITYNYTNLDYDHEFYIEKGYPVPDKLIAISFDDGPSGVTQALLDALGEEKVSATFFLIGQNIRSNKAKAQAIFDAGHELGNHSDGYSSLGGTAAKDAVTTSLEKASSALKEVMGHNPAFFRAPNVNYGANLTSVCEEQGMAIIGVDCWSSDWQEAVTTEQIIANVLNSAKDGSIINCHELQKTVDAIPEMIDGLRKKGFWVMTVGQLAAKKGKTLEPGKQYDSIK